MNKQKWMLVSIALLLMGGTLGLLLQLKAHQRLGAPAVKTRLLTDSHRARVELPEQVLDYKSKLVEDDKVAVATLPKDTSFGQRHYQAATDGFELMLSVVLMGSDRTSLHKPQFCLRGAGWAIQQTVSDVVRVERPCAYDLPVKRLNVVPEKAGNFDGRHGVYVYWFVADGEYTAEHEQRMWWMARDLLRTGVLQRWAYISCFAACLPGQEDATFERMKKFIAASVPEFQLTPKPAAPTLTAQQ